MLGINQAISGGHERKPRLVKLPPTYYLLETVFRMPIRP